MHIDLTRSIAQELATNLDKFISWKYVRTIKWQYDDIR